MDYQVSYHPEQAKRYPMHPKKRKAGKWMIIVILLAFSVALLKPCMPRIRTIVEECREVYDINIITQHLQQGESLGEAVTAFCLNVLEENS